jgi:hypothetical protein
MRPVQLGIAEFAAVNKAVPSSTATTGEYDLAMSPITAVGAGTESGMVKSVVYVGVAAALTGTVTVTFKTTAEGAATPVGDGGPYSIPLDIQGKTFVVHATVAGSGATVFATDTGAASTATGTLNPNLRPKIK